MHFSALIREAWVSISASRLRTFLAMLGIVIGVSSVVLLMAIGAGSRHAVEDAINKLGSNLLMVTPSVSVNAGLRSNSISRLGLKDAEGIAQLSSVIAVAPSTFGRSYQVAAGNMNWNTSVVGTTPEYFSIRNWNLADGAPFTADDVRLGKRVAVLGATVAEKLFNGDSKVGRMMRINGVPFVVGGVLEARGQGIDGRDQDDTIFVPIITARNVLLGQNFGISVVQTIYVQAASPDTVDDAAEDVTSLLRQRHRLREAAADDFTIRNLSAIMQTAADTSRSLSLLLGAIASISLVVGSIGILNIMLVTVTERTREIGIRKAIGATQNQVLTQFLLEAIIISCAGSMIGLIIGIGGGFGAEKWFSIPSDYTMWSVVLALVVAVVVGLASGMYPAYKAAKLEPIEALRTVGA